VLTIAHHWYLATRNNYPRVNTQKDVEKPLKKHVFPFGIYIYCHGFPVSFPDLCFRKPHIIALDEPTNYIDMETLDALVQGLARFKGGIIAAWQSLRDGLGVKFGTNINLTSTNNLYMAK
jgi:hypothetical protein